MWTTCAFQHQIGGADGLWDGAAQYVGSEMIAPKDPHPKTPDGPDGIWQAHIFQKKYGNNPTSYSDDSGFEPFHIDGLAQAIVQLALIKRDDILKNEEKFKNALSDVKSRLEGNTEAGAYFLNFIYDEDNIAYHSQVDTWQREFGYNDLYDDFFRIGSKIAKDKFYFTDDGKSYVLWVWKGDYWNLQSGAEMGLYVYGGTTANTPYYNSIGFELPMTLSLYNYYSKDSIYNVFSWAPDDNQWWITGFNPSFPDPNPNDMVIVGTIDFSGRKICMIY